MHFQCNLPDLYLAQMAVLWHSAAQWPISLTGSVVPFPSVRCHVFLNVDVTFSCLCQCCLRSIYWIIYFPFRINANQIEENCVCCLFGKKPVVVQLQTDGVDEGVWGYYFNRWGFPPDFTLSSESKLQSLAIVLLRMLKSRWKVVDSIDSSALSRSLEH